jgi:hypothetical protein
LHLIKELSSCSVAILADGDAVHLSDAYIDAPIDTVFDGLERK